MPTPVRGVSTWEPRRAQTETAMSCDTGGARQGRREGITVEELERARGSMRGGLALAMEDPNSRMVRLGREFAGSPHLSVDERLAKLEAVTLEEVQAIAAEMYRGQRMIGAVGPYEEGELDQYLAF